ncbi:3-hydroxyacyl-CoA dehydrogenase NAD-binding domain-containing protein [Agrobacterium fabacearum]|uniref:3-hydroxyacyl-CoA dehydrogenase NAD-binding domain-containing protein n=1 Tax=Agrobacterium tumefaciens TaxID=358 RepID=UPI002853223C|nr:3-hydroxyacyl-CoA dehydrogenase NAD-binding domain-containing protein [Agrobacterium tumefaciens]MDR5012547.1 3-hydroxyacyl-CoA dehydrogenase NAD-binding domain-containing protein [Agrobacterium tumefaciens]
MNFSVRTLGVIGAGQMGLGIVEVAIKAGIDVNLFDVSANRVRDGIAALSNATSDRTSGLLEGSDAIGDLSNCDLVIEAVPEKEEIKRDIFERLCSVLKPDGLIGTNTSSLSITRLAKSTDRPDKFLGIHFMNPVPQMKLIELVRGLATSEETYDGARAFASQLGKEVTTSEDSPAFIVNRIVLPMINEAIFALYEGVGTAEAIDRGVKLGANHPMGPLRLADFIGLDTCLAIMRVLHDNFADQKYRPCPLLVKYVEAGWLGRKAGRGFYHYDKIS